MKDIKNLSEHLENILWSLEVKGELQKARERYIEALEEIKELPESKEKFKLMSFCLLRIANVENALGNIENAEKISKEAFEYATKSEEKVNQGQVLLVLASIYNTKRKFKKALTCIQNAKHLFKETSKDGENFDAIQGYGWSLLLEANILFNMEEIQKAESITKEALKILKDINNTPGIIRAYEVLAKIYEKLDMLEEKRRAEKEIKILKERV